MASYIRDFDEESAEHIDFSRSNLAVRRTEYYGVW